MKRIVMILVAVALVALPTMAQTFSNQEQQVFRSTSTMTPSGSQYSAQPAINADGTAYNPTAQAPSGRRKTGEAPTTPTTPGDPNPEKIEPLGDAVVPLMLMALVYGLVVYFRSKKKTLNR